MRPAPQGRWVAPPSVCGSDRRAMELPLAPGGDLRQTFTALNGLRILAALLVVSFHYGTLASSFPALPHFVQNLANNGTIALPFFYVLSGFVLTHAYSNRE